MNIRFIVLLVSIMVINNQSLLCLPNPFSSGKMYNWTKPNSSSTTRYGLSLSNKSNQDIFIMVENANLKKTEARFGSLRYFTKAGSDLAMVPVFRAGSAESRKQSPHWYDADGNYTGQYWEGVNIDLDISVPTTISIYSYDRTMSATKLPFTTTLDYQEVMRTFLPGAKLLYCAAFTTKKTMYIKWNGQKLSPQKGILGVTSEGFNLKNNVKQADIKKLS